MPSDGMLIGFSTAISTRSGNNPISDKMPRIAVLRAKRPALPLGGNSRNGTACREGPKCIARWSASGGVFLTLPAQPEQNTSTYGRVTNENLGAEARAELAHDAEERDGA